LHLTPFSCISNFFLLCVLQLTTYLHTGKLPDKMTVVNDDGAIEAAEAEEEDDEETETEDEREEGAVAAPEEPPKNEKNKDKNKRKGKGPKLTDLGFDAEITFPFQVPPTPTYAPPLIHHI
jgi:hypothetical protein